eukprot:6106057-Prymnesium_polylepis.1
MGIFKKVCNAHVAVRRSDQRAPRRRALRFADRPLRLRNGSARTSRAPPGTQAEIKKNYNFGNQLGSGNFAVVKKASANKDAEDGAVKKGDE